MSVLQLAEKAELRRAEHCDAEPIFALATSLFGQKQFLYTIYQAPQSVRHLAKLIAAEDSANPFIALEHGGRLVGYYEALIRDAACFLNYIGVDDEAAGNGYGSLLLSHFAALARDQKCSELLLDVFESNDRALRWYERAGFERRDRKYFTRFSLGDTPSNERYDIGLHPGEVQRALAEEAVIGFSRFSCCLGDQLISVGLIGGHTCKLLDCGGLNTELVIDRVASVMRTRSILIVSSPHPLRCKLPVLTSETVLRMGKSLT